MGMPLLRVFPLIFTFIVVVSVLYAEALACSFEPHTGTADTVVPIKIGNTYFQIPEKNLYSFMAVPAERESMFLHFPHSPYGFLTKKGERGPYCDEYRVPISKDVDFCTSFSKADFERSQEIASKIFDQAKLFVTANEPVTWKRDLEITNKFDLGTNPCGEEVPLSWDGVTAKTKITEDDIVYALAHKNTQIRKFAKKFVHDSKSRE